jgi:ubiquitin C-terminal hydrolase
VATLEARWRGTPVRAPNDAHEFYTLLADALGGGAGGGGKHRRWFRRVTEDASVAAFQAHVYKRWKADVPRPSAVTDALSCQVTGQVVCAGCGATTHRPEVCSSLAVPVRASVAAGVSAFLRPAAPSDGWTCDRCGSRRMASQSYWITRAPAVLVVALQRYDAAGRKSTDAVVVDAELDLSEFAVFDPALRYSVRGVVCHDGGCDDGHYVACVRGADGAAWAVADDAQTRVVPAAPDVARSCYMVTYERTERAAPRGVGGTRETSCAP